MSALTDWFANFMFNHTEQYCADDECAHADQIQASEEGDPAEPHATPRGRTVPIAALRAECALALSLPPHRASQCVHLIAEAASHTWHGRIVALEAA